MATEPLTAEKIYNTPEGGTLDLGGAAGSYLKGSGGTFQPVILSTQTGADLVQKGQERLDQLSGQPSPQVQSTNNYGIKSVPEPKIRNSVTGGLEDNPAYKQYISQQGNGNASTEIGTVKYINPQTGQTQSLPSTSITPDLLRSLQSQGYSLMDSSGSVPSWVLSGDTSAGETQLQADKAKADLENLKAQIPNFAVSDAQLQSQIDAIGKQWDSRIEDMKAVNERRNQSIKTLGVRIGSQYTGSLGGVFGGIVAEEERQGVRRIAELEGQKQSAISAAREAARIKNWEVFGVQLGLAEKKYKESQDAVAELNKVTTENNKKIQEQLRQSSRDSAIAGLFAQGITDPAQILNYLNYDQNGRSIGDFTIKDISESLKTLMPDRENILNFAKDVSKNPGVPYSVTSKILSSSSMSEALEVAGDYAEVGSGIIGEYVYYKRQAEAAGQVPLDFNSYSNMDANRKRSIVQNVDTSGMTTKQQSTFNAIVDKYNKSPLVAANDRATILKTVTDKLKEDPTNASLQVSFIYSLIQALDTYQSAVREGEITLVGSTQGVADQLRNLPAKIEKGSVLSERKVLEYASTAKVLTDAIGAAAEKKQKGFQAQAKQNGEAVHSAFNDYISTVNSLGSVADEAVKVEEEAKRKVESVYQSLPDNVASAADDIIESGGTNSDVLEYLKQKGYQ